MTTQNQIRQTFTHHWCHPGDQAGIAWLIKGDFDHFKLTNDLYGSLICDYLLDWTLEVIEAELRSRQKYLGSSDLLWDFVGDDVTVYIPPSSLQEQEVEQLLWEICQAIEKSFHRRYRVAALPLPAGFFDDIPTASLEAIRNELEGMDIVLDFARRQRGYLVLFPTGAERPDGRMPIGLLKVIQKRSGKSVPLVGLQPDWIYNPDDRTSRTFNEGFLQPPSISFAACSIRMGGEEKPAAYDRRSMYERMSLACQSALRTCKLQRKQVLIQ